MSPRSAAIPRGAPWLAPILAVFSLGLSGLAFPSPADAQTVVSDDFEDGTTQGWVSRGTAVLTNTTEAANTGTHSLKTTGRTAGFNGPALNLLGVLSQGTPYQVSVAVRLVSGEPATQLIVTVQRTPTGGPTQFDRVVASAATGVTDGGWVTLQGSYSFAGDVSGLLLYVESSSPTASYYIDDFSIVVVPRARLLGPTGQLRHPRQLRDRHARGLGSAHRTRRPSRSRMPTRTPAATACSPPAARPPSTEPRSTPPASCATARATSSNLWAKLAPGQPTSQLRVSIQRTLNGVTNFNTVVGNTTVTADQWVRLRATYDFVFNYTSLTLYVESASGTASFYIDDFDLTFVPPPVAERDIASVSRDAGSLLPRRRRGLAGRPRRRARVPVEEALQQHHVGERHEVELDPADGGQLQLRRRRRPGRPREGERHAGPRSHARLAQPDAGLGVQRRERHPMTPTPENKALLLQRLENHIRAVVGHFGDDVYAWDVVNEVIDPSQADGFRRSPWFNITGTDYIDRAFQVAHEVAPDAKLYVNDYSTTDPAKRAFLLNLIAGLQEPGRAGRRHRPPDAQQRRLPVGRGRPRDGQPVRGRSAWTTR